MKWYYDELAKAENRPTGVGFFEGQPRYSGQLLELMELVLHRNSLRMY